VTVEFGPSEEVGSFRQALDLASADDRLEYPYAAIIAPDVIVNHGFEREIGAAISDPGLDGLPWIGLASDGIDRIGRRMDTGNFLENPATPAAVPLRVAIWADPAVAVVDTKALRELEPLLRTATTFSEVVHAGTAGGLAVFLTPRLRYSSLSERWSTDSTPSRPKSVVEPTIVPLDLIRPDPMVTVVIRTLFGRPELLARNLRALEAEHGRSAILEVIVASTEHTTRSSVPTDREDGHTGALPITMLQVDAQSLPSRSAAMLAGLRTARGDYVWFVDDDDWVAEGSIQRIKDAVHALDRPLLIGAAVAVDELWVDGELASSESVRRYLPDEWHRAFTGWNFLPNCSLVIPRVAALDRIAESPIVRDLGEDYALQLLLLTAPGSAVNVIDETIAYISRRSDDDTAVAMIDRTPWLRDLGSHISDLSRDASASTAAFWRLGHEIRQLPYPDDTEASRAVAEDVEVVAHSRYRIIRSMTTRVRRFIDREQP
jgi:hypothetical protein